MTPTLIALKLTLDALELPPYRSCFSLCSNGLYLSQAYVYDLGYHYHYFDVHPTSDRLLQDFVHLTDALESGDRGHYQQKLTFRLQIRLSTLRTYLEPERTVSLTRPDWIALLADLAFLRHTNPQQLSTLHTAWKNRCPARDMTAANRVMSRLQTIASHTHAAGRRLMT